MSAVTVGQPAEPLPPARPVLCGTCMTRTATHGDECEACISSGIGLDKHAERRSS